MRIKLVYLLMFGILCILNVQAMADTDFVMTQGDNANNSSFYNTGGVSWWSPAGLPVNSGDPNNLNVYYGGGYLIRSPASGSGYLTGDFNFTGDAVGGATAQLRIGLNPSGVLGTGTNSGAFTTGYATNDSLIFKQNQQTLTVYNMVLDKGIVRDGLGADSDTVHLAGNLYITANAGGFAAQCKVVIDSLVSGPGPIYIGDVGNVYTDATHRGVYFTSGASTYAGNIIFDNDSNAAGRSQLIFTSGSVMNFNIGANGVNNSITGLVNGGMLTANGTFNINVSVADTTLGDQWILIGSGVVPPTTGPGAGTGMLAIYAGAGHFTGSTAGGNSAYSNTGADTFNVAGFTNEGGGYWAEAIPSSSNYFVFNEGNGTLYVLDTVPEPATIVMILTGLLGMGLIWLRRKIINLLNRSPD